MFGPATLIIFGFIGVIAAITGVYGVLLLRRKFSRRNLWRNAASREHRQDRTNRRDLQNAVERAR